jgi:hypothetical protein
MGCIRGRTSLFEIATRARARQRAMGRPPPVVQYDRSEKPDGEGAGAMFDGLIGQRVVLDLRSSFVCLGTLVHADELYFELKNADLHDLRDTETSRENYVIESRDTGIKRNRKRVLVVRSDVVALARLDDVTDE